MTWGPEVADARRLWSQRVVELVAARVDAAVADVADRLLSMQSQRRYLLLGRIARTRRSTVLAAVDQLLAREVALKLHHDAGDEATWKVMAEVQAMAGFDHANIARVHELGDHEGSLYSVMELGDADLEAWSPGRLWGEVLDRLIEAGHGLAAVHAAGLVHADVKPENILIKGGVAKLADFGMVTTPGWSARIGGTPGYIAPEVADGRQGPEGDVFAFACTAWSCLLGRPPFGEAPAGADSFAATLVLVERAREGEFSESDRTAVPPEVISALRCALRPDPAQRPALAELLAQLTALRSPGLLGRWRRRLEARRTTMAGSSP